MSHRRTTIKALAVAVAIVGSLTTWAALPTSAAAPPPAAPFDSPSVFCTKVTPPSTRRTAATPGVTPDSIVIGDDSFDPAQLKKLGVDQLNFHQAFQVYWDEVNKCGGINGRKVVLKWAPFNPAAVDMEGHKRAECRKLTEEYKAFVILGVTGSDIQRCAAIEHKSIIVAPGYVSDADFRSSSGRIVSTSPSAEGLAALFIADTVAQSIYAKHKVAVLAVQYPNVAAVAGQKAKYVDRLAAKGVAAGLEVLSCAGPVCKKDMGNVVRHMKTAGVDLIVLSPEMPATNIGWFFKEMQAQKLKATVIGPDIDELHSDSVMLNFIHAAGTEGAAWANQVGWTSVGYEVRNGWRSGQAKETPVGRMCTQTLAKGLRATAYAYSEANLDNGRWAGATQVCVLVRAVARAIYRAGAALTTDKVVAALRTLPDIDRPDTMSVGRKNLMFMEGATVPTSATTMDFDYPCGAPKLIPKFACMLPRDRPARVRSVKL